MPDPITGAAAASPAAPAEPAAAAAATATAPDAGNRLANLSPEERQEWRKSGKLPDAPAASSTASAVQDPPAGTPAPELASEPADDDPEYKPKTAKRIAALLDEIKTLKARPPAAAAPAAAPPAASAPAAVVESKLAKPDPETFQYGTADPAYLEALTDYKIAKRDEDRAAADAKAARDSRISAEAARIRDSWKSRVEKAKGTYADFEAVAFSEHSPIPQGSLLDSWILESEHGADVLYALHKTPAEIDRLLKLSPLAQTRELVKLEDQLLASRPRLMTTAPEPGPTLSARAGDPASGDPVKRAIKNRDTGAYMREQNERDLAGRRRK